MSATKILIESVPMLLGILGFIYSKMTSNEKHLNNIISLILLFCGIYFAVFFFCDNLISSAGSYSLFDLSFNKITLFIGFIFSFSLFMGFWPIRHERTLSKDFLISIVLGLGLILANNLPTFFFFWTLQRFVPFNYFVKNFRNGSVSSGGTYIIQHLMTFICFLILMFLAWDKGFLYYPMTAIPTEFFTAPVLFLAFVIVYQSHGIFPFHSWIHDLVGNLPWFEISAIFLSRAGVLLFVQLLLPTLNQDPDFFKILLLGLSIFSSIYWSFRGLFEENITKSPVYFYIAQTSLIMTGLQANGNAATGSYLHLIVISLSGTALFSILSYIQHDFSIKRSNQFYGLAMFYPKLSTLFCLFGFCMIGVPLGASFVVEDLVINGLLEYWPSLGLGHIFASCLNGILFFMIFSKLFLGQPAYRQAVKDMDMPISQMFPYVTVLFILFLIGIWPDIFLAKLVWAPL